MTIKQHLANVINYYEQEIKKIEKMENPSSNDKAWATVATMMLKSLRSNEKKLLKVK